MSEQQKQHRPIRSYVLRQGRLTRGQERAFESLWPLWGVDVAAGQQLDLRELFDNDHPLVVEIGFGNGETLAHYAQRHQQTNFVGIEVHRPGVGHLLLKIEELGLTNVRIIRHDAAEVLDALPDASLDGVQLFFPDPWHKKKHHKRRILQPSFIEQMARLIRSGGFFHAATDWEDYAGQMMEVLSQSDQFENSAGSGNYSERPAERPLTKFEQRGQRLGHGVWDLVFRKKA
ncbi:MAG: tRNA (guanosine(46)-N7)-methyltransferase TrmB [Pseudomonadota bacterium]